MRTYSLHRLCNQLNVKPRHLTSLASYLHSHGFINMIGDDRYSELDKFMSGDNRDELFKLVNKVKTDYDKTWGIYA